MSKQHTSLSQWLVSDVDSKTEYHHSLSERSGGGSVVLVEQEMFGMHSG